MVKGALEINYLIDTTWYNMALLPDTQKLGVSQFVCAENAGNVYPATVG